MNPAPKPDADASVRGVVAFVADPMDQGERLDRACARHAANHSRTSIAKWCESGAVLLNGHAAKASARVRTGDRVEIHVQPPERLSSEPEAIPIEVLFEDDDVLVLNKPAGMVVHPARGHASGTLVNAVLHHVRIEDVEATHRPGIVHRLDKGTSGLMVVAKTGAAREALKAQFQAHTIDRAYVAIVQGLAPERTTFDTLHGRHPTDRKRFTTRVRQGRRAVTHLERIEVLAGGRASLVRCRLETGRTHQIRVHLAESGFAVLGDPLYGKPPRDGALRAIADGLGHQALHAELLGFQHPASGKRLSFHHEVPPAFEAALTALRELRGR